MSIFVLLSIFSCFAEKMDDFDFGLVKFVRSH